MGVIRDIFAGRGPAGLALDFGAETITLLAEDTQAEQGWSPLAAATLADEDFSDQIEAMRAVASEHAEDCAVDLWLPADQILNTHLALSAARPWNRREMAQEALASRTGLAPDAVNFDMAPAPGDAWAVCAVEAKIVAEARDYAQRWGFAPNMVTTRHADAVFAAPPDLTGEPNRRPMVFAAAGAAAVAAFVAIGVLAWPAASPPTLAPGPERIAMAPAIALPAPSATENAIRTPAERADEEITVSQPAEPAPGAQIPVATVDPDNPFAATIRSPSQSSPFFLSVDFSLPQDEAATPIYANVAYRAPSLGRGAPIGAEAERSPPGDQQSVSLAEAPVLSLGASPADAAPTPSDLGSFDVAALGPAPLALRTQDLYVESDTITAPEVITPDPGDATTEDPAPTTPEGDATQVAPSAPESPVAEEASPAPAPSVEAAEDDAPAAREREITLNAGDPRERTLAPESAPDEDPPGPGAVAAAPAPGARPDSLDMSPGPGAVAAAPSARTRPGTIKPKPKAVARNTSSAKTVRAPSRGAPTGRGLANAATLRDAIALDQTSLLGVFGSKNNRRALLRMADGRMKRVSQGEVIDGWVISNIQATSMRMTRGGEVLNLKLIR